MVEKPFISFHPLVADYLDELGKSLFDAGCFGFRENAITYVTEMVRYVSRHIGQLPAMIAPPYFARYGDNLKYILYRPNRTTTWYIFFQQQGNHYLIRHITNNHREGQFLR